MNEQILSLANEIGPSETLMFLEMMAKTLKAKIICDDIDMVVERRQLKLGISLYGNSSSSRQAPTKKNDEEVVDLTKKKAVEVVKPKTKEVKKKQKLFMKNLKPLKLNELFLSVITKVGTNIL